MAAILQFRQGSKTSFISSGPYISEPFFDTDTNIIHIGVSGSSTITLTKLEDINSGSFSVSGDISGSNLYLSGDITASNTLLSGDITIGGNIILGDQVQDNITVSGQFDSDLIPSASLQYDLGSTTKKWNVLYASRVDATELTGSIQVTNTILPDANEVYDLGSPTQRFRDFYISSGSLRLGSHTISSPDNGDTVRFSGPRVQIGGLTGGRIEYNPTRNFLNLKGPSTDTSIPIVSSRMYLTGSNGEGYMEMGGDSDTIRFGQGTFQLGGNSGGRIRYNSTSNRIHFQGPTTDEPIPLISSKVILSGSNGEINLEVGADGNLSSSNLDGSQTVGIYSGSFSGDGSELTFGGTDIISSSAQVTLLGYDGYFNWIANADNSNSLYIGSGRTLYFEGGDGITTEARNPGNYYITIDLDTGSAHFTSAVAGVGAPQGTISGSQQVIDSLPSGVVSGSSQVINILDSLNSFTSSQESKNTLLETHTGSVNTSIDSLNSFTNSFDTAISLNSSDVTILGNLTVQGTQTQLNTATLNVEDLNILLASGSTTSAEADGAGITIDGANKSLIWNHGDSNFLFDAQVSSSIGFSGDGSSLTFGGTNIVSSSQQVVDFLPQGTVSGSDQVLGGTNIVSSSNQLTQQVSTSEILIKNTDGSFTGSGHYASPNNFTVGTNSPTNLGATQLTINDNNTAGVSGLISFTDSDVVKSYDYVNSNYRYVDTNTGVGIVLKPDADSTKSWVIDTDGDLVSNGGSWASGNIYTNNLIARNEITASNILVDFDINADTFIGTIEADNGVISGSAQLTSSFDLRYVTLGGNGLLSSSNENFNDFSASVDTRIYFTAEILSQSFDLRLNNQESFSQSLDTLYASSQSLHTLIGNFPTSGSLGTAAFYNVSSSLADDPNVIPNVKAVYDYINNVVQAADITGVSASLGLSGGGNAGYVSLSLDTTSQHFINGVQSAQSYYGGWYADATSGTQQHISSGEKLYFRGNGVTGDISTSITQLLGVNYIEFQINTGSAHFTNAVAAVGAPVGTISGSQQITDFGYISASNSLYIDANDFSFGGTPQNLYGLNQITLRDDNVGYSGLLAFQDNTTVQSFDYVASPYRYIDTNTGIGIVLKPDADGTKAWVIDTDGDLVSNGGSWASGNAYMNNLIASSSVTASNLLVDNDITTNNLTADGNVTISGNLTVSGTTTYISTNNVNIGDNILELNFGGSATTGGILVKDATGVNTQSGSLLWDATNDYWKAGRRGFESKVLIANGDNIISGSSQVIVGGDATGSANDINVIAINGVTITNAEATQLANIDTTTISSTQWGYLGSSDQGIATTNDVTFNDITASNFVTTSELEVGYAAYMDTIYRSTANTNTYINLDANHLNFGIAGTNELQVDGTETHIYGNLRLDGSLELGDGNTVDSTAAELNLLNGASANTVVNEKAVIYGSAGEIAATTVSATGDIVAYASSDRRLKDEIIPISNPIEKINQIGGYSFVWNTEKQHIYKGKDYGVIAQEIEEILPELVDTRENGYKAVKYDRLVSLLIEGIKELSEEVKELKEKINNRE